MAHKLRDFDHKDNTLHESHASLHEKLDLIIAKLNKLEDERAGKNTSNHIGEGATG